MAVTELATLPLTHNVTKEEPVLPDAVIEKLKTARTVLEKASGYSFNYFQQVEDPSIVYLIGRWDSTAAHGEFLPSPENQRLLEMLKDDILTEGEKKMSLWHLDAESLTLRVAGKNVLEAPVISFNRHFVPSSKKEGFSRKFAEVNGLLEGFTEPFAVSGGWRIEKDTEEKDEWALFSGFESVDHHFQFAKTEDFIKYRDIVEFMEGFDLKHFKAIEGLPLRFDP
jgi:heme-degrading monooxygenase HmoA